jgi:hypothetical protein
VDASYSWLIYNIGIGVFCANFLFVFAAAGLGVLK